MHEAKINNASEVTIWGSGTPRREFLYADDLADACLFLMNTYDGEELVNIGTGEDLSIAELADTVRKIVGFSGQLVYDRSKPDGTPRKLMDVSKLHALGWKHKTRLEEGISLAYKDFLNKISVTQ
jgi:GDP-L-fucose synthase